MISPALAAYLAAERRATAVPLSVDEARGVWNALSPTEQLWIEARPEPPCPTCGSVGWTILGRGAAAAIHPCPSCNADGARAAPDFTPTPREVRAAALRDAITEALEAARPERALLHEARLGLRLEQPSTMVTVPPAPESRWLRGFGIEPEASLLGQACLAQTVLHVRVGERTVLDVPASMLFTDFAMMRWYEVKPGEAVTLRFDCHRPLPLEGVGFVFVLGYATRPT